MTSIWMPKKKSVLVGIFALLLTLLLTIHTQSLQFENSRAIPYSNDDTLSTRIGPGGRRYGTLQDAYVGSDHTKRQQMDFKSQQTDPDDPYDDRLVIEGFFNTQPPLGGSPKYLVSVNFNRPRTVNLTHNLIPLEYHFSIEVKDKNNSLPRYASITLETWQIYPDYRRIVTDSVTNGDGKDKTINLKTQPFLLSWSPNSFESYRANILITFKPEELVTKISGDSEYDVYFKLIPANRPSYDREKSQTFWFGSLEVYPDSIQSQSYGYVSSSPIEYPVPGPQVGIPTILKAKSSLTIPYNQAQDTFTKFEIWYVYQFNPKIPIPGQEYFDGQASTISIAILNGVASFAYLEDDTINETFDGCWINNIRITQIHLQSQTIYFHLDLDQMDAVYKYNNNLLHIECHSLYYIVTPSVPLVNRESTNTAGFLQIQRSFEGNGDQNPRNPAFNALTEVQQWDILNAWSQIIPITYKTIYSTLPIPISITYPSMTEYLIVEKAYQFKLEEGGEWEQAENYGLFQENDLKSPSTATTIVTPTLPPNIQTNTSPYSFSSLFEILKTDSTGTNNAENNNPANPHPDQMNNVFIPSYSPRDVAFDDDYNDPDVSQLVPEIALVGAIQWFGPHRQTLQDKTHETLAVTCSFQYTIPVRIDPESQLYDKTGYHAFKNQFLSEPGMSQLPPRFRLFVPFLHTHFLPELSDLYRLLYIQISSVQTGYLWSGQVTWNTTPSLMGYTNWINLDYETILFPPELMKNGEIDSNLYVNNPPVIEITFNTYGGMLEFPVDSHGKLDFTNYPQQCLLDLQHSVTGNSPQAVQQLNLATTHKQINQTSIPSPTSSPYTSHRDDLSETTSLSDDNNITEVLTSSDQQTLLTTASSTSSVTPRSYQNFFLAQPIPYHDLNDYMQTGVELTALSSTIPQFRIINHNAEPIQGLFFYLNGLFSFGVPPSALQKGNSSAGSTGLSNDVKIWCGYDKKNSRALKPCYAKEIKWKPNFVYICLKSPVVYHIEVHLSDKPYLWYRRGILEQYPEQAHLLYPVITLQVQHNMNDPSSPSKLQPPTTIMNQTVTMSFPYGDKLAPRSSRATRPFEWTILNAHLAAILASVSVAFCAGIVLTLGCMALYYYYGARKIMKSREKSSEDEMDYPPQGEYSQVDPQGGVAMATIAIATPPGDFNHNGKGDNKKDEKNNNINQSKNQHLLATTPSNDADTDHQAQVFSPSGAYLQLSINSDPFETNPMGNTIKSRYNIADLDLDDNISPYDQM